MKKIIPILFIAVLALTGCQNKNPYAGTYTGTFKFFNFSSMDITQPATSTDNKQGKMQFATNPLTNDLLLYTVIPLSSIGTSTYASNSAALEYVSDLLEAIGNTNSVYNSITERVKNVAITADFTGSSVHAEVQYEIEILGTISTRITIVQFDGVRQ